MEADVSLAALLALDAALGTNILSAQAAADTVMAQVAEELLRPLSFTKKRNTAPIISLS